MPDSAPFSQWLQPELMASAGTWIGLIVSLLVFSAIFGDHWLARLGQAILVGAGLGYAAAVTALAIGGLPFVQGLLSAPLAAPWNWIPVLLACLLVLAAGERILLQGEGGPPPSGFRRVLRWGGVLPAALLLAGGIGVVAVGTVQGTLLPQFLAAARTGIQWESSLELFFTGLLTLVITASALVFWGLDPQRHLASQPAWVQRLMRGWVWLGQRAVWLAAGALFARLAASRTSLLIAQLDFIRASFMATELWRTLQSSWGG
jgi:hypothetical protein